MTGVLFLIALYAAYGTFCLRFLLHAFLWIGGIPRTPPVQAGRRTGLLTYCRAAGDLLFFTRLLRTNGCLWAAEWLFHGSLLLVFLRHLRYVLDPVPGWVWALQPWGVFAGYLLPPALAFIVTVRMATRHEVYSSRGNLLLLGALLAISISGVAMHAWWKPDLVGIKEFMMGMVSFAPAPWPGGGLFALHLAMVLVIVPYLPTHIFIAPVTIVEARLRDEGLHEVLHGD